MRKSTTALAACLLVTTWAVAAPSQDQIRVERRGDLLELRWSDSEERLQGTVHPAQPREGEPIDVSLHVGNFQGPEFDGPLTLTFHQVGSPSQQTRTLTRSGVNWHTQLTPDAPGPWELEVRYQSTYLKVLTARFTVASAPLPRYLGWGLVAVGAGVALVLGLRGLLRRAKPAPVTPPGEQAARAPVDPLPADPLASASASAVAQAPVVVASAPEGAPAQASSTVARALEGAAAQPPSTAASAPSSAAATAPSPTASAPADAAAQAPSSGVSAPEAAPADPPGSAAQAPAPADPRASAPEGSTAPPADPPAGQ